MSFTFVSSNPQRWTDWKITDQLFDNQFAPAPEALEPMGNSIRRLLNATLGGREGWAKLPMQQFTDTEPERAAMPLGWKGPHPDSPFWGEATPARRPMPGPQYAWTEGLPAARPRRPTAAQARDELEAFRAREELRRERELSDWRDGVAPRNPRNPESWRVWNLHKKTS